MDNETLKTLIRLEERMITVQGHIKDMKENSVTRDEFRPVQNVVYVLVSAVGVGVIGAVLNLVLRA